MQNLQLVLATFSDAPTRECRTFQGYLLLFVCTQGVDTCSLELLLLSSAAATFCQESILIIVCTYHPTVSQEYALCAVSPLRTDQSTTCRPNLLLLESQGVDGTNNNRVRVQ